MPPPLGLNVLKPVHKKIVGGSVVLWLDENHFVVIDLLPSMLEIIFLIQLSQVYWKYSNLMYVFVCDIFNLILKLKDTTASVNVIYFVAGWLKNLRIWRWTYHVIDYSVVFLRNYISFISIEEYKKFIAQSFVTEISF